MPFMAEATVAGSCSECGGPGATPVTASDFARLADTHQIDVAAASFGGGGGAVLAVIGLRVAQRVMSRSVAGLAFCGACRGKAGGKGPSFLFPKVCAGLGFFLGLTVIGLPAAIVPYVAGAVSLRRRLRDFRAKPGAGALTAAMDAVGSLTVAVLANVLVLLVFGGVFVYMLHQK
jgi:uncharacterized membrane protein YhaH (DUF805 family)